MRRLRRNPVTIRLFLLLAIVASIQGFASTDSVMAQTAITNPNYYFNRETAFVINYVMDYGPFGGIYTAVDKDGTPYGEMDTAVWGIQPGNPIYGTDKSLYGHAVCIRYMIQEYQRVTEYPNQLNNINALLEPGRGPITANDLLDFAQSCADFIVENMVIEDAPQPCTFTVDVYRNVTWNGRTPYRCDVISPEYVFYWSSMNADATDRFIDDTNPAYLAGTDRAESIVPWSIAELGLMLQEAGYPASVWGRYRNHVDEYLAWQAVQPDPPPYNGNQFNNFGVARDVFLAPTLSTMYLITGDISYRQRAENYLNTYLGTGVRPIRALEYAIRDGTYTAGLARGVVFAHHAQRYGNTDLADRDQWWDFGNWPLAQNGTVYFDPNTQPTFTQSALSVPFAHFRGRELLAGVLRSWWLFHTFGANQNMSDYAPQLDFARVQQATLDHWNYTNTWMWDDDPGVASWIESLPRAGTTNVYKPCFSAGTDVPLGDWSPPQILDKVHTINSDLSATVTVTGVVDPTWDFMSVDLAGSGVKEVEVVYSFDAGQTWQRIPAQAVDPQTYVATIPPVSSAVQVYYYAVARDLFDNTRAFPEGSETWSDDGTIINQSILLAQTYNEQQQTPTPTVTATGTQTITPTVTVTGTQPTATVTGTQPVITPGTPALMVTEVPGIVSVSGGDIQISKRTAQPFLLPGQFLDWTITVTNPNSTPVSNISLTDPLPAELEPVSADSSIGTVSISGQNVTISIPVLNAGESARWTIRSRLRNNATLPRFGITNRIGDASATVLLVTGLPATGETPWWRTLLVGGALMSGAAGIYWFLRRR